MCQPWPTYSTNEYYERWSPYNYILASHSHNSNTYDHIWNKYSTQKISKYWKGFNLAYSCCFIITYENSIHQNPLGLQNLEIFRSNALKMYSNDWILEYGHKISYPILAYLCKRSHDKMLQEKYFLGLQEKSFNL